MNNTRSGPPAFQIPTIQTQRHRGSSRAGVAAVLFNTGLVLTQNSPADNATKVDSRANAVDKTAQIERGKLIYLKNCFICHQFNGQGIPGVYPPLAKSDFLMSHKESAIRIGCEGQSGEIEVNGKKFDNTMPVVILNDQEVADVLTYVRNSWGNESEVINGDEVKAARTKTQFPTFEALQQASTFPPLPKPPDGFTLREVVRMPNNGVRLASDGAGEVLYALCANGDVYRVVTTNGEIHQMFWAKRYLEHRPDDIGPPVFVLGMTMDKQKRLYIASNQLNDEKKPIQNIVTIYRTTTTEKGDPADPKPWFQTSYPGSPAYLHAVENLAFGPDGFLYVGNGARTDGGQTGGDTNYFQGGETPVTACIWRIDPRAEKPDFEIYARGVRNAYGFCWNDKGEMFATENGPDADAPEELNLVEKGKHYGFPYTFADWGARKAYSFTADPPTGLEFTPPIANLGPDGGFNGEPMYSFDPHSSPGGIVWLGGDFPDGWRGTLLLTRFGNFLKTPKDNVGYDVLQARLQKNAKGIYEANIATVLAALGRPIDLHLSGQGKIYICEYSRGTHSAASYSLPGRIIELAVKREKK